MFCCKFSLLLFDKILFRLRVVSIECRFNQALFQSSVVLIKCGSINCRVTKLLSGKIINEHGVLQQYTRTPCLYTREQCQAS